MHYVHKMRKKSYKPPPPKKHTHANNNSWKNKHISVLKPEIRCTRGTQTSMMKTYITTGKNRNRYTRRMLSTSHDYFWKIAILYGNKNTASIIVFSSVLWYGEQTVTRVRSPAVQVNKYVSPIAFMYWSKFSLEHSLYFLFKKVSMSFEGRGRWTKRRTREATGRNKLNY